MGGRNIVPRLAQNTTPSPMARGPPQLRNLSLGAHTATVDRPPTIPAVYHAARVRIEPPQQLLIMGQYRTIYESVNIQSSQSIFEEVKIDLSRNKHGFFDINT